MKFTVVFRIEARDEAVDAAGYIADQGYPENAARWYKGLESAIASLSTMPHRCEHAREHALFPGIELRQLIFKSHRIIFTVRENQVHVLHVRHVARADLESLSDEPDR